MGIPAYACTLYNFKGTIKISKIKERWRILCLCVGGEGGGGLGI